MQVYFTYQCRVGYCGVKSHKCFLRNGHNFTALLGAIHTNGLSASGLCLMLGAWLKLTALSLWGPLYLSLCRLVHTFPQPPLLSPCPLVNLGHLRRVTRAGYRLAECSGRCASCLNHLHLLDRSSSTGTSNVSERTQETRREMFSSPSFYFPFFFSRSAM